MKVKDLYGKGADYNPRDIDEDKLAQLNETIRELGSLDGIVFNVRTQTLISGHQRTKVFEPDWNIVKEDYSDKSGTVAIGYIESISGERYPYREVDWDIEREMAANLAANAPAGRWNLEKKTVMLEKLVKEQTNMRLTGHSNDEIKHALLASTKGAELAAQQMKEAMEKERAEKPKNPKGLQELYDQGIDDPEDIAMQKTIDINITLPAGLVLKADKEALAQGLTEGRGRSMVIKLALEEYLSVL